MKFDMSRFTMKAWGVGHKFPFGEWHDITMADCARIMQECHDKMIVEKFEVTLETFKPE